MGKFLPPTLEARGIAIKGGYGPSNYDTSGFTEIFFNMPAQNDIEALFGIGSKSAQNGGHIQFSLKDKTSNTACFDAAYTPDYVTVYFNAKTNYRDDGSLGTQLAQIIYHGDDLYSLAFSNILYKDLFTPIDIGPIADRDYTVQIRFGDEVLSAATGWINYAEINGLPSNFTGFAAWRGNAIARQEFGEWSNLQSYYAYGPYKVTLTADQTKWLPTFTFDYQTDYNDIITQIEVRAQYILPSGETKFRSEVYSGDLTGGGHFVFTQSLNIAPTDNLYVQIVALTEHGVILLDSNYVTFNPPNPQNNGIWFKPFPIDTFPSGRIDDGDPNLQSSVLGSAPLVVGEELKDGIIAKRITCNPVLLPDGPHTLNIYRFNYYTREAVLLISDLSTVNGIAPYILKDYTPEMGEQYQYAGVLSNKDNAELLLLWEMYAPFVSTSNPYGELDKIEFPVLTTRDCQLRFQGNTNITEFKNNIQESFQSTIGSKYPFYSRTGKSNYRTLKMSSVVSINFDPTSLFLKLDSSNVSFERRGLIWENTLVVPIDKVFEQQQFSLGRTRFDMNNPFIDQKSDTIQVGPATIYDDRMLATNRKNYNTQQSSRMIYLERVFRAKVMEWLNNGKPKLFRSETEGNIIVIISDVNFTPVEHSQRMTYQVSLTMTEIAEYSLSNLLKYNLLPTEIVSDIDPTMNDFFGDYDPDYSDNILRFPDNDAYDIATVRNGDHIDPILIAYEIGYRVTGGKPPYNFSVIAPPLSTWLQWETIERNGVTCLRLYGTPPFNTAPQIYTIRVIDSEGTVEQIFINVGGSNAVSSQFTVDDIPAVTYNGNPHHPIPIVRENGVDITAQCTITYGTNINAGIGTVSAILPNGGSIMKEFIIMRANVTINQGTYNISKVYNNNVDFIGATIIGTPTSIPTLPATVTIVASPQRYNNKNVGTSIPVQINLSLTGVDASNYTILQPSVLWSIGTITQRGIEITPNSGQYKTFGTQDPILQFTSSPMIYAGDTFSGSLTRDTGTDCGDYEIRIGTLTAGANYLITFVTGVTFEIKAGIAPTISWPTTQSKVYGSTLNDVITTPTSDLYGTFEWLNPTYIPPVGTATYTMTYTPFDTINWIWPSDLTNQISVTITKKELELINLIMIGGNNGIYNGSNIVSVSGGELVGGIIGLDDVDFTVTSATVASKDIGIRKQVTYSASLYGADADNYQLITSTTYYVDIAIKPVTIISAIGQDRNYNGMTAVDIIVTISGIEVVDTVATIYNIVGLIANPDPGIDKPCIGQVSLSGTGSQNYSIDTIITTITINPGTRAAPPAPTIEAKGTTFLKVVYGAGQEYSIDGGVTWSNTGYFTGLSPYTEYSIVSRYAATVDFVASPSSAPLNETTVGETIPYAKANWTGSYDATGHSILLSLEAGTVAEYATTTSGPWSSSPILYTSVGTYTIYFRLTRVGSAPLIDSAQVIINPLTLYVTAEDKSKVFNTPPNPDPPLTYISVPAPFGLDTFTGAIVRDTGETTGTYWIRQGTLAAPSSNYVIQFIQGRFVIGNQTVIVTPTTGQGKQYSDSDTEIIYTLSNEGIRGQITGSLSRVAGENVGTYNITLGTLSAPGIIFTITAVVYTITPKTVSVVADDQTSVFGIPLATLTYNNNTPIPGLTGSLIVGNGNVGTWDIEQGTLDSPNYIINYTPGEYTITPAPINRVIPSYIQSWVYTGSAIIPSIELLDSYGYIPLVEGIDYTIAFSNNIDAGSATIVATGIGNYGAPILNLNFTITSKVIVFNVDDIPAQLYTGQPIQPVPPDLAVYDGTNLLSYAIDYRCEYTNNVSIGTGTVYIIGINNYAGSSQIKTFNIITALISPMSLSIELTSDGRAWDILPAETGALAIQQITPYSVQYIDNNNDITPLTTSSRRWLKPIGRSTMKTAIQTNTAHPLLYNSNGEILKFDTILNDYQIIPSPEGFVGEVIEHAILMVNGDLKFVDGAGNYFYFDGTTTVLIPQLYNLETSINGEKLGFDLDDDILYYAAPSSTDFEIYSDYSLFTFLANGDAIFYSDTELAYKIALTDTIIPISLPIDFVDFDLYLSENRTYPTLISCTETMITLTVDYEIEEVVQLMEHPSIVNIANNGDIVLIANTSPAQVLYKAHDNSEFELLTMPNTQHWNVVSNANGDYIFYQVALPYNLAFKSVNSNQIIQLNTPNSEAAWYPFLVNNDVLFIQHHIPYNIIYKVEDSQTTQFLTMPDYSHRWYPSISDEGRIIFTQRGIKSSNCFKLQLNQLIHELELPNTGDWYVYELTNGSAIFTQLTNPGQMVIFDNF